MKKNKSEPAADMRLVIRLHNKWCKANGYKLKSVKYPLHPAGTRYPRRVVASSAKLQAPSLTDHGPGDSNRIIKEK